MVKSRPRPDRAFFHPELNLSVEYWDYTIFEVSFVYSSRWLISLLLLFVKGFQFRDTLKSNRPVFQVWRVDGSALDLGPELVHERVVLVT